MDYVNPTFKTAAIIIASIVFAFTSNWHINLVIIALGILGMLTSKRVTWRGVLLPGIPVVLISLSYFFTALLFPNPDSISQIPAELIVGTPALTNAVNIITRMLTYISMGLCYGLTTDKHELIFSFIQQGRMPHKMGYGVLTSINLITLVRSEFNKSRLALRVRGVKGGLTLKALNTMLVRMIRWADNLAISMETKGFTEERTMYQTLSVHWYDWALLIGLPLLIPILNFTL